MTTTQPSTSVARARLLAAHSAADQAFMDLERRPTSDFYLARYEAAHAAETAAARVVYGTTND